MQPSFLQRYLESFHRIRGWFQFDAALLFMAYNQLAREQGLAGDILEIGVYHGLSTIALASMRRANERLVVIDPFDDASEDNAVRYGLKIRDQFEKNFAEFYRDASFLTVIARSSGSITPADTGRGFAFTHIDGGHSREETHNDLRLCHELLNRGGLLALDDYFNPDHPAVCEGGVEFFLRDRSALKPLAIAYNKVLFQKDAPGSQLNESFLAAFAGVRHEMVKMWDCDVILLKQPLRDFVDLIASTPHRIVRLGSLGPRAILRPSAAAIEARRSRAVTLQVELENVSGEPTPHGEKVFGLSYHLLDASGHTLRHDNARTWITKALRPGEKRSLSLNIEAPETPGRYAIEIDLVWENVMWFRDVGNPTARVELEVA